MIVFDNGYPANPKTGLVDNSVIRAWAWANGHYIAEYGPIPWRVVDAFKAAHRARFNKARPVPVRFI